MRIEPAALATALGALDQVDLDRGLAPSVLQLLAMTKNLLDADRSATSLARAPNRSPRRCLMPASGPR